MRSFVTPKLAAYAAAVPAGLITALFTGRIEPLLLILPFLITLMLGLLLADVPDVRLQATLSRSRIQEGDVADLTVYTAAESDLQRCDVALLLPEGLGVPQREQSVALVLPSGGYGLTRHVRADRWGAYFIGTALVRCWAPFDLLVWEGTFVQSNELRVYPRLEYLRAVPSPWKTNVLAGNELARTRAEGVEFADVRAFVPGDAVRRINWRVSARRGELAVNQQHPERNGDVVLFLDTFAELVAATRSSLDVAVHLTAALAHVYLERRDRVGVIGFGGELRWLEPDMGSRQLLRIIEALLDTRVVLTYAWKTVTVIPSRVLPPSSLLIAVSPLLDERFIKAILDLHARGFQIAVVEVSPFHFVDAESDRVSPLGIRLWKLRRGLTADEYLRRGVPFASWTPDRSAESIAMELRGMQRWLRIARA